MLGEGGRSVARAALVGDALALLREAPEERQEHLVGLLLGGGAIERRGLAKGDENAILPAQADVLAARSIIALLDDELAQVRIGVAVRGGRAFEVEAGPRAVVPAGRA